jgi:hypothetical protein
MVQLPEVCAEGTEAAKAGYKTICEIGKERIRRAGAKIVFSEQFSVVREGMSKIGCVKLSGFDRMAKGNGIDSGNISYGYYGSSELVEGNRENADCPYFKTENCLLKTDNLPDVGFRVLKLDSSNMKDVYYTPDEYARMNFSFDGLADNIKPDRSPEDLIFQVMLDLGIPLSAKITQDGEVYYVGGNYLIACFKRADTALITEIAQKKPHYAVFRDSSFASDSAMVNFEQVFAAYSPNTMRRVL